jgi:hypothetical protein
MGAGLALAQGAEIERRTGMRELPILMNGPMVRSVLEGRKVQTRRPVKPQPPKATRGVDMGPGGSLRCFNRPNRPMKHNPGMMTDYVSRKSPFGTPGDVLYVRENWKRSTPDLPDGVIYQADNLLVYDLPSNAFRFLQGNEIPRDGKWRPSIHMPRELSQIKLLVKRSWVERIRDISYDDAIKEGVKYDLDHMSNENKESPIDAFCHTWISRYGEKSWEENEWDWACEFEVIQPETTGD